MTGARAPARRSPAATVAGVVFLTAAAVPLTHLLGHGWAWLAVSFLIVVAAATRLAAPGRATVTGFLVTTAGALVFAAVDATAVPGESWLPTAVRRLGHLLGQGMAEIIHGYAPLPTTPALTLVLAVLGAGLWLALELATRLGAGGIGAALLLLGLWAPAVAYGRPPASAFGLGAAALLVLLAATPSRGGATAAPRQTPGVLVGALTVAALVLIVTPVLSHAPGWSALDGPDWGLPGGTGGTGGGSGRLAADLDLRASLVDRSSDVMLTYTTTGTPGILRLYTLTDFDGRRWARNPDPGAVVPAEGTLWPGPALVGGEPVELTVTVAGLVTEAVPLPLEPRSLVGGAGWRYAPERDEVISSTPLPSGTTYEALISPRRLDAEFLTRDRPGDAPDHLVLPETAHLDDVAALAAQVAGGAPDAYSQALALQTFLRNTREFTYSLEVPDPVTDDAVWDFLTHRTGYCVQFATAFTVMARTLGLPTRVAVGYLPGQSAPGSEGTFAVTGSRAHAWPEVFFADAGWVRFEPTPAGQAGPPPIYTDPLYDPNAAAPPEEEFPVPGPAVPTDLGPTPDPEVGVGTASGERTVSPWWIAVAVALLPLALALRRRSRPPAEDLADPETWWARFAREATALGVVWDDTTTPRALGRAVKGRHADAPGAADAVDSLVEVVERSRWAPQAPPSRQEDLARWVADGLAPLRPDVSDRADDVPSGPPST